MPKINVWLNAARIRTLPLSVSGITVGTALANHYGKNDILTFVLALCTTVGFQVTSNFANDYGDGVRGTDNADRIGPQRVLQRGLLTRNELKKGIVVSIMISILLTMATVYHAFGLERIGYLLLFFFLGAASVWAAIRYTIGVSAYGYRGLGDVFVFIFFGLLAVVGSMFLYTKFVPLAAILPAVAIGLLSVGVLNLNNLRDFQSDRSAGKNTLIVKMGLANGKRYHYALLTMGFLSMLTFSIMRFDSWVGYLPLVAFIPIVAHLRRVRMIDNPRDFDPELKKVALSTFLLSLLCFVCYNPIL